jgi:hypothetical protein
MMMKKTDITATKCTTKIKTKRSPTFPKKLYQMLENANKYGYEHLISWTPDRNSFKIHVDNTKDEDEKAMFVKLLKQYFKQTKYDSFLRQLMLYNFERIYKGPQRGVCKHVLFIEGRPDLFHRKSIHDFQQQTNTTTTMMPTAMFDNDNNNNNNYRTVARRVSDITEVGSNECVISPFFVPKQTTQQQQLPIIPMRLNNLVQSEYNNSKGKDSDDDDDNDDDDDDDDGMHSNKRQGVIEILDDKNNGAQLLDSKSVKSFNAICCALFDDTQEYGGHLNDIMNIVDTDECNNSLQLTIPDAEFEMLLNGI